MSGRIYFKNRTAFTEDDNVVYNVYFRKIHQSRFQIKLSKYFSTYGPINKIFLLNDKKSGIVCCMHPNTAFKILQNRIHYICGEKYKVDAANSWHQPRGACASTINRFDNLPCILELNDDCLLEVLNKLDLRAQLQLAQTCQRFQNVFIEYGKIEYKTFAYTLMDHYQYQLSSLEFKIFYELVGRYILDLNVTYDQYDCHVFDYIIDNCTNVEYFRAEGTHLNCEKLTKICAAMRKIKKMHLFYIYPIQNKQIIKSLEMLTHLETLIVEGHFDIPDVQHIDKLINLREINLQAGLGIKDEQLEQIKYLENVQIVAIRNLKVLDSAWLMNIAHFTNLIEVNFGYCSRIGENGLLHLIQHCKRLQRVHLTYCKNITQAFVIDVINVVENCRDMKRNEITFFVQGTSIDRPLCISKNSILLRFII